MYACSITYEHNLFFHRHNRDLMARVIDNDDAGQIVAGESTEWKKTVRNGRKN